VNTGAVNLPKSAKVALVPLPLDVEDQLRALGPGLTGRTALILPTQPRGGKSYYLADDVEAGRAARMAGLEAGYLGTSEERRYLNEFATGWELELALAVAQNLTADGIAAVIQYVWERARLAIRRGRHDGPEADVPVRLKIAQLQYDKQGGVKVKGLEIDGPTESATTLLNTILAGPTTARAHFTGDPVVPAVTGQNGQETAR
jgi:hypothetical protein